MKKPSPYLWSRQRRLAEYREVERTKKFQRGRFPRHRRYVQPGTVLVAPVRFDVSPGRVHEVVKFLRAAAVSVLKNRTAVRLDFRATESFFPAATILLFAEVDRIISMSDLPKPVTVLTPRQRRPREVLKQIGFFELTGDRCDIVPESEDVVYWRATKGRDQSGDQLAILEVVANRVNKAHADQLELSGVWRGVSEAVANSFEHAYKRPRKDGFTGLSTTRWWMFTQLRQGVFSVAVCDLGCGYLATINETIPEKFVASVAATMAGGNRDAIAIDTAMRYGRTGTSQSERGKGSRDAMSVVQSHGRGELMIISNTGSVAYSYQAGEEAKRERGDLGIDLQATIVWWKLPLKEAP